MVRLCLRRLHRRGIDRSVGVDRFTFGLPDLRDGFSFLLLAMATFALAEILMTVLRPGKDTSKEEASKIQQLGSLKLSKAEVKEIAPPIARSSVLGFLIGVLPGAGATIASFMAYGAERNFASKRRQEAFGKGSLTGIAAPEAANNAASSGAFVPLLTLGIPGSGTTALMLGALIAYGIQPGPQIMTAKPDLFWGMIASMWVALGKGLPGLSTVNVLAVSLQFIVPFNAADFPTNKFWIS